MMWALLSVFGGLGDAVSYSFMKKLGDFDTSVKLLMYNLAALPFLLPGFLIYGFPKVPFKFYIVVIINIAVWLPALFLLMKSLEMSELSMSIPMLSFTPIFLLLISYVILKEFPTIMGLAGILIVVLGSYIINMQTAGRSILEPFKMFKSRGILYMLMVAFLFSISANLTKIGVRMSNPVYFIFITFLFASIILTLLFFRKLHAHRRSIIKNARYFIMMGIATASSELLINAAFTLAIVPYVISLKRTSILFSVAFGLLLFKEKNLKEKIAGALLMFVGATLIILSQ